MVEDIQHRARLRRVIEHPEFLDPRDKLLAEYPRFKDVWIGAKRELQDFAHEGTVCHPSAPTFFLKRTARRFETPSFTFYYTFDDQTVTVYDVEVTAD